MRGGGKGGVDVMMYWTLDNTEAGIREIEITVYKA